MNNIPEVYQVEKYLKRKNKAGCLTCSFCLDGKNCFYNGNVLPINPEYFKNGCFGWEVSFNEYCNYELDNKGHIKKIIGKED